MDYRQAACSLRPRRNRPVSQRRSETRSTDIDFTPAGYKPDGPPNLLVVLFDGQSYLSPALAATTTLNNLIGAVKIPTTVGALVNPESHSDRSNIQMTRIPVFWTNDSTDQQSLPDAAYGNGHLLLALRLTMKSLSILAEVIKRGAVWIVA